MNRDNKMCFASIPVGQDNRVHNDDEEDDESHLITRSFLKVRPSGEITETYH